mmetsp:Transcript_7157/g.10019  ORF Transcript_7157/g.10019 Transcript_7157/m.10019 type:complete len:177 (-) Transcript_7157:46-576(-)
MSLQNHLTNDETEEDSPFTADIMDKYQGKVQAAPNVWNNYGKVSKFHGEIATIRCFENNPLVRRRLTAENGNGRVLIVDGGGSLGCALMGDALATEAIKNNWKGVILNGAIRDSSVMKSLKLGVKALGTNPTKSGKENLGSVDESVSFSGLTFEPGKWAYADEDGVVVSNEKIDDV